MWSIVDTAKASEGWLKRWKTENESQIEDLRRAIYRFRRNRLSVVGLAMILLVVLVALFGSHFVPYPQDGGAVIRMSERLQPPSTEHFLGTDDVGRDLFSRIVLGTIISLQIGVIVLVVAIAIGVPLGAIAGYWGGWVNETIMRITDVFFTVPGLILAIAIAASLGPSIHNTMFAIALVWWPGYTRLMQGMVLSLRETDYVQAARGMGASRWRIVFGHILPNSLSPIIVKASMDMGFAILVASALGFIGLGASPPTPEWGVMVANGRTYLPDWWWYATFPGLAIFFTVVGFNLLGDGLRDLMDPRARR